MECFFCHVKPESTGVVVGGTRQPSPSSSLLSANEGDLHLRKRPRLQVQGLSMSGFVTFEEEVIVSKPCGHSFHTQCLIERLLLLEQNKVNPSCPICPTSCVVGTGGAEPPPNVANDVICRPTELDQVKLQLQKARVEILEISSSNKQLQAQVRALEQMCETKVLIEQLQQNLKTLKKIERENISSLKSGGNCAVEETRNAAVQVFMNQLIMDNIARHLPAKSLLTLRRTCKLWNTTMVKQMRSTAFKLKFNPEPTKNFKMLIEDIEQRQKVWEHFLGTMRRSIEIPFGTYTIGEETELQDNKAFDNLFLLCGSVMTQLKITIGFRGLSVTPFQNMILKHAPHLRELEICDKSNKKEDEGEGAGQMTNTTQTHLHLRRFKYEYDYDLGGQAKPFLVRLFSMMSNLEVFESKRIGYENYSRNKNLAVLLSIGETLQLHKLKQLDLAKVTMDELQILVNFSKRTENQLKLSCLNLANFESQNLLNELLRLQAPSLRSLTVGGETRFVRIPKLPDLKELNFIMDKGLQLKFQSFPDSFTNLTTFKLLNSTSNIFENWKTCNPGVSTLAVNNVSQLNVLATLAILFPNIRHLDVGLVKLDGTMAGMWALWPNVETLAAGSVTQPRMRSSLVFGTMDQFITGIPLQMHEGLKLLPGVAREDLGLPKTTPGISDLKYLTGFTVALNVESYYESKDYVTDISVYYGLMFSTKLMSLCVSTVNGISPTCRAEICQIMSPLASVQFARRFIQPIAKSCLSLR